MATPRIAPCLWFDTQAEEAARTFQPTDNPIPVTEGLVREILSRAWAGRRP